MQNIFFYTIGIAFASGIFIRSFFDIGKEEILFGIVLAFALALVWRRESGRFRSPIFLVSLALLCFSLGALRLDYTDSQVSPLVSVVGEEVAFEGVVVREPDVRSTSVHLYVRADRLDELVLVTADRFQEFQYGDRVAVAGELEEPETFETDLGRTFNYPGYLKARGARYIIPFAETEVVETEVGNKFIAMLLTGKHRFMEVVERTIPEPQAGLGEGVLLGVKRALGEDLEEAFRKVGIIHIVVLSGYNIMLVADALGRTLSFLLMPRVRVVVGVLGIVGFALLVGLSATVVRASLMAVLVLIARATGRTYAILRALMLAGVVMLLVNPYLLAFDPGFQLSFMATLGLVVLAPLIEARFAFVPTQFKVREFLTATLTTQIFVLPLLLYQIGEASLVAPIVNVLVLPMVPIAMGFTFVTGILGALVPILGTAAGFFAYLSLLYVTILAEFFAALPFAAVGIPAFSFMFVVLMYAMLGYGIHHLRRGTHTSTESVESDDESSELDELAEWTIEEEIENAPGVPGASSFPFR